MKIATLILPIALAGCYNTVIPQPRTLYEKAVYIDEEIRRTTLMLSASSNGETYQMLKDECDEAGRLYEQSFGQGCVEVRVILEDTLNICNRTRQRVFFQQ